MSQNDLDTLRRAVLDEAQEQARKLLDDALTQARALRRRGEARAEIEFSEMLRRAEAEAVAARAQAEVEARLEAQTLRLQRREAMLNQVFEAAQQQLVSLTDRPNHAEVAQRLVREGVARLSGQLTLRVRADARTLACLDAATLADLGAALGVTLEPGAPLTDRTGVIVETPDGRRRYDNTFETRLARMRDTLRPAVHRILIGGTL